MTSYHSILYHCGIWFTLGLAHIIGCTAQQMSGSISETTNGRVSGALVTIQGEPAGRTRVLLLPAGYDPVKGGEVIAADTTDSLGRYLFLHIPRGDYAVYALHLDNGTNAAIAGIHMGDDNDTIASDTLRIPGSVRVMFSDKIDAANGYIYIPGTLNYKYITTLSEGVTLDRVPSGIPVDITYSTIEAPDATIIRQNVAVASGETTMVWNTAWKYSRNIILNTAASGAAIAGSVTGFPVLIRLTRDNFDFSMAKPDGGDIRFATSGTTFLPIEIEHWDPVAELAEMWVNVDTIRGNDSTQSVTMYWGNPHSLSVSNSTAVFDTANGFAGVWHLSETSVVAAREASSRIFTGAYKGGLPRGERGPSGIWQNFTAVDTDYVDIGDVLDPEWNSFTISVWIKRQVFSVRPQALIAKTNGDLPRASYGYLLSIDANNYPHFNIATGGAGWGDASTFLMASDRALTDTTTWHHVCAVIDRSGNGNCKMYVDGIDQTSNRTSGDITSVTAVINTLNLRIGTESDTNLSYQGAIDEAIIAFAARSADWVKLCYMNQKTPDALVMW